MTCFSVLKQKSKKIFVLHLLLERKNKGGNQKKTTIKMYVVYVSQLHHTSFTHEQCLKGATNAGISQ